MKRIKEQQLPTSPQTSPKAIYLRANEAPPQEQQDPSSDLEVSHDLKQIQEEVHRTLKVQASGNPLFTYTSSSSFPGW